MLTSLKNMLQVKIIYVYFVETWIMPLKSGKKMGIKIILVKCNANIGNEQEVCMGGNYELAEHNEREDRLVEWTKESIMFVENT